MSFTTVAISEDDPDSLWEEYGLDLWATFQAAEDLFRRVKIRPCYHENVAFVALDGGKVIGAITLGQTNEDGGMVFTFSVAVDQDRRREGIAKALVKDVLAYVKNIGIPGYFQVQVVNPAMVPLLESFGFEPDSRGWSEERPHLYLY